MEPIFDESCSLAGWLNEERGYVFNTRMRFVAFIKGNGLFTNQSRHIGFFMNGIFRDKRAGAVAFLRGSSPGATPAMPATPAIPATPATPAAPASPASPAKPAGSFSSTSWEDLISGQ